MESIPAVVSSVYLYWSSGGMLVYVGVTDRGVKRLHEHADSKPWWPLVAGCAIEHYESRDEALDREQYLIRSYRPAFNYQHNPDRDLSYDEKLAKCSYTPTPHGVPVQAPTPIPPVAVYGLMSLKERRRFHETLTSEQRRVFPCIECGERPGERGRPSCAPCVAARRERGRTEAARRIAIGEERKLRLQSEAARQLMPTDT